MHRCIVEFHTLPDTDRPRTQNYHFFAVRAQGFVLRTVFVRGIKIRRYASKFTGAGIHHLIDRDNPILPAHTVNAGLIHTPRTCDIRIGKTAPLCIPQNIPVAFVFAKHIFQAYDFLQMGQEESIYFCNIMNLLRAVPVAKPLHYSKNTAVIAAADAVHQLLPVKP